MISFNCTLNKLANLGIAWESIEDIADAYNEPHRYYHNWDHILKMIESANEKGILDDSLLLAIVFHDIVYNPKRSDNEEESIKYFLTLNPFPKYSENICDAIRSTKDHKAIPNPLSHNLIMLDLEIFNGDLDEIIEFEKDIFKEYQFVDWSFYKKRRMEVLEKFNATEFHKNYLKYFEPKIGVFAGSFNPFHIGHLNILEKAEKIFDKVIVAKGNNSEKVNSFKSELPTTIQNRQIEYYNGLLTDFLKGLDYPITLIRGLRDANDLLYESNQICFLKDLMPELNIIEILCDKDLNHISSSAVRSLSNYGVSGKYILP